MNVVAEVLPNAETVFDKFHVLQHASAALDDVRRQEFFRAGAVKRKHGRGKRWLLLRRWKTVRGSKRAELQALFAANRRLFKAYVLREQLDRLWTYKTRTGVLNFLLGWIQALRWQRLPEMERLGDFLFRHQLVNLKLAGLILTVAMVGAIVIARKRVVGGTAFDESLPEQITGPATPIDDNPHSIPVVGTENPRQKEYPET